MQKWWVIYKLEDEITQVKDCVLNQCYLVQVMCFESSFQSIEYNRNTWVPLCVQTLLKIVFTIAYYYWFLPKAENGKFLKMCFRINTLVSLFLV